MYIIPFVIPSARKNRKTKKNWDSFKMETSVVFLIILQLTKTSKPSYSFFGFLFFDQEEFFLQYKKNFSGTIPNHP